MFVKEELMPFIQEVQTGEAAVGIMGMVGNKGGVAVRFMIYDTSICLLNSHLNAHQDNVLRRNQDYQDISKRIVFLSNDKTKYLSIFDHDYLFWIGDLNYRIDLPDADVRARLEKGDYKSLFQNDQLKVQMNAGAAFDCFLEEPIQFAPTYKYDLATGAYTT